MQMVLVPDHLHGFVHGLGLPARPPSESRLADPRSEMGTWWCAEAMRSIPAENIVVSQGVHDAAAMGQEASRQGDRRRGRAWQM